MESLRKFHHSLIGQLLGSSMRSWLMIGWILQCLEQENRGPALKNTLVGDAEMHKGLLNRESLRAEVGVKYFRDVAPFHQRSSEYFLEKLSIYPGRGNIEMVKWIGTPSLLLSRVRDVWMDMLPVSIMSQEQRENQYLADVAREKIESWSDQRSLARHTGGQGRAIPRSTVW